MDKFVVKLESQEVIEEDDEYNIENKKMMELELLRDYIEKKMSNNQKMQIMNILKEGNTKHTKNKNGYFINMNNIDESTIQKLKLLVNFSKDNTKDILKTEEKMNEEKNKMELLDKEETGGNNGFLNLEDLKKDKYNIPHPDGELRIDSPKIFDSSKPLRLRSKGYNGGDMYVKLNVKFERTN